MQRLRALARSGAGMLRRRRAWVAAALLAAVCLDAARLVRRDKLGDFNAVHAAAARLVDGEPLYQPRPGRSYPYSPAFAFAVLPLGLLPLPAAKAAWYLVAVLSLALSCRLAARLAWPGVPPRGFWILMLSVPAVFMYNALLHGQVTPLMLLLTLLSLRCDEAGRPGRAGLCLAAAVMIKPFPLLFVAYYAIRGRWRSAGAAVIAVAALLVAPALHFRESYPAVLRAWREVVWAQQTLHDVRGHTNQSVTAFWFRTLDVDRARGVPEAAVVAVGLTAAILLGTACWASLRSDPRIAAALFMVCWAALPPYGWKHYYATLLFPGAVLAGIALGRPPWAGRARAVLVAGLAVIAALHVPLPFDFHRASAVLWIGVLVFSFLVAYAVRARPPADPAVPAPAPTAS